MDDRFFDQKIKELVLRYNYTLNQKGIYEAIKYMYTYWPDPTNKTHIREQYIHVSIFTCCFTWMYILINTIIYCITDEWLSNKYVKNSFIL